MSLRDRIRTWLGIPRLQAEIESLREDVFAGQTVAVGDIDFLPHAEGVIIVAHRLRSGFVKIIPIERASVSDLVALAHDLEVRYKIDYSTRMYFDLPPGLTRVMNDAYRARYGGE